MRTYTERAIRPGNIIKADNINKETAILSEQLNGRVGSQSVPLASIDTNHLEVPVATTTSITSSTSGASCGYHRTETRIDTITYDATNGTIVSGWNDIESDFLLDFTAKAGMVIGSSMVCGTKFATDVAGTEVGADSVWEVRVLANSLVVAQSGYIPVGTYTVDLPFCFPVGSEAMTIKMQFRILNFIEPSLSWTHPELSISSRLIWLRNVYR